ncbi:hypothetical protein POL68_28280 [Stigmatella sp. ncwal1]|uniref:Nucleoside phosphorylase domain-containing protein n=1 Tax=Stigmatella ashevillensis TaxID=2995309 RepID=A0ABT5DFE4_9BACT|nr:hypothetical protein [Stigmatella ashevillena]
MKAIQLAAQSRGLTFEPRTSSELGDYFDLEQVGRHRVLAVKTRMGAFQYGASTSKAILFERETGAQKLIALGMAFGMSRKVQGFGDVLVSKSIFPYDDREMVDSPTGPAPNYSRTRHRQANAGLIALFEREVKRTSYTFRISFGTLLSGGARVSSQQFRDELFNHAPSGRFPVIGGDMEGVGFLAVAPAERPVWIVVKGISDFGEDPVADTAPSNRATACLNAATLVLSALQNDG